jgi:hypothetical protein
VGLDALEIHSEVFSISECSHHKHYIHICLLHENQSLEKMGHSEAPPKADDLPPLEELPCSLNAPPPLVTAQNDGQEKLPGASPSFIPSAEVRNKSFETPLNKCCRSYLEATN